jgi:MFS family permease
MSHSAFGRKTFGIGWLTLITSRPWHYWVGFGVLTATGISFGTIIPAATAVTRWFSRYRGRAMAVTLSASGFAGFFVSPADQSDTYGERGKLAPGVGGGCRHFRSFRDRCISVRQRAPGRSWPVRGRRTGRCAAGGIASRT